MIRVGSTVKWKWGKGEAQGKVEESYTKSITRTIDGTEVTRNGESGNKALYIKTDKGDFVLKLESEVEKA